MSQYQWVGDDLRGSQVPCSWQVVGRSWCFPGNFAFRIQTLNNLAQWIQFITLSNTRSVELKTEITATKLKQVNRKS